jgi:hypothetical protein
LATEQEVGEPIAADPALIAALQAIPAAELSTEYTTTCSVVPLETLYLKLEEGEGSIDIVCPEYTLPSILLPLYGQFDALLAAKLAESGNVIERPPAGFPLTAVLDYERVDGARLTIFEDGTAVATDAIGNEVSSQISTTQVVSLTTELISNGVVRTGLNTFNLGASAAVSETVNVTATPKPPRTRLIVRGPGGVYDAEWFNTFDVPELLALNTLLAQFLDAPLIPGPDETPELNETLTPEAETTAEAEPTTTVETTSEPESTPTPRPSATP